MDATEISASGSDGDAVVRAAALMQVDARALVNVLTTRTIVTRDERVISAMTGRGAGAYRIRTCVTAQVNNRWMCATRSSRPPTEGCLNGW
jgi:hypothetical protein